MGEQLDTKQYHEREWIVRRIHRGSHERTGVYRRIQIQTCSCL